MSFGGAAFGSVAFSAEAGPSSTAYTLALGTGTFTLTGQAVGMRLARTMPLGTGTFTLTGQSLTIVHGKTLVLGTGLFTVTGQPMTFHARLTMALGTGTFTLTGKPLTLTLITVPHHYRVLDQSASQYQADLAIEPLYVITDGFAAKYRVSDIAEDS